MMSFSSPMTHGAYLWGMAEALDAPRCEHCAVAPASLRCVGCGLLVCERCNWVHDCAAERCDVARQDTVVLGRAALGEEARP